MTVASSAAPTSTMTRLNPRVQRLASAYPRDGAGCHQHPGRPGQRRGDRYAVAGHSGPFHALLLRRVPSDAVGRRRRSFDRMVRRRRNQRRRGRADKLDRRPALRPVVHGGRRGKCVGRGARPRRLHGDFGRDDRPSAQCGSVPVHRRLSGECHGTGLHVPFDGNPRDLRGRRDGLRDGGEGELRPRACDQHRSADDLHQHLHEHRPELSGHPVGPRPPQSHVHVPGEYPHLCFDEHHRTHAVGRRDSIAPAGPSLRRHSSTRRSA
jgi:hypothetical protein